MDNEKPRILITGFAPFGGVNKNPSWLVTRTLRQDNVYHTCLPVDFKMAPRLLLREIRRIRPSFVFGCGVHFSRDFALERVAKRVHIRHVSNVEVSHNVLPWPYKDVQGVCRKMDTVHSTVSSDNAGAWVCECIAFWISEMAKHYDYEGGFVHCPLLSLASLSLQRKWWKYFLRIVTQSNQ